MSEDESFEVLYDWEPENPGELRLTKGDQIIVLQANQYEHGWWHGKALSGAEGLFPKNYVRKINANLPPAPPPRPLPRLVDEDTKARPLSVRTARRAEDHSFVFESLEAFDSLLETGFSIEVVARARDPGAVPVEAGCRVTLDCKALVWEGAYTVAKPLVDTATSSPLCFTVAARQVAEGLDLALQQLKNGDSAMITCVPNLAYGEDGLPPDVPPRVHIIYEVVVRDVKAPTGSEEAPTGPAILLSKAPSSAAKAALEDKFFQLANRSSTRMQVKLASNPADVSTDDLIKEATKMGIS